MYYLKNNYISFVVLILFIFVSGCVDKKSSVYSNDETGVVMQTNSGTLLSSRKVVISGLKDEEKYWGSIIGGIVAGAATYGITEGDNPLEEAAIIIAVVGGAIAGTVIHELINTSQGIEYTIETNDGENIVIVQAILNESDIIPKNTKINIVYSIGGYVRVIPVE